MIRPTKSRLGLFYVSNHMLRTDLRLLWLTVMNALDRDKAIKGCVALLRKRHAPPDLCELATRTAELVPAPPPGSDEIVTQR